MRRTVSNSDCERYRQGYPGMQDPTKNKLLNLRFYKNELRSQPDNKTIEQMHADWFGDYRLLESRHGFIQWLFPIREHGMNYQAQPLTMIERQQIIADPAAKARVLTSYRLILDFYGMRLLDEDGNIERGDNWESQYQNLNWSSHNYLRITRILKCLGELGYESLKIVWLKFFAKEIYENQELTNCRRSFEDYWIEVLKDDAERQEMRDTVEENNNSSLKKAKRKILNNEKGKKGKKLKSNSSTDMLTEDNSSTGKKKIERGDTLILEDDDEEKNIKQNKKLEESSSTIIMTEASDDENSENENLETQATMSVNMDEE